MRILVTGGAGFIGSNLIRMLVNTGHDVLNIDKLTYAGNTASLEDVSHSDLYRLIVADVADYDAVYNTIVDFQPDWIAHLAAESHVDRSIDGPAAFIQTNVVGTFQLLSAARNYWSQLPSDKKPRFRFLHVSTDEVYGSLDETGWFHELTRYDPHSPYSASKASSDHLVRAWNCTYGLPTLITNCSNNYGPYQFPEKLIPVVILKMQRGEPIPVYGDGKNVRDWLFVEDHCRALIEVLRRGTIGETYNIGGNNELRNIDLVTRLCRIMDRFKPRADNCSYTELIEFVKDRPGHDRRYAIDASKIRNELGWRPLQENDSGFEKTVRWYLENEKWCQSILSGEYKLQRLGAV